MVVKSRALTLLTALVVAGVVQAAAPSDLLRRDGNNWRSFGNDFYRVAWLIYEDAFGHITYDYHQDDITFQFTAGASGTVQAVRLILGNSDGCGTQPDVTVSIQTDNNGSPSGNVVGTAWSGGIGYWASTRWNTAGTFDFPVGEATLEKGTVYHIRLTCHNLTPGVAGPDGSAPVDFRVYTSDQWNEIRGSAPSTWQWEKYMTRSYDGLIDPNMYGKHYNHSQGIWKPGAPEDEDFKLKTPMFEMFATATEDAAAKTGWTGSDPIDGLSQGFRANESTATINNSSLVGESFMAHYPSAKPVAQTIRVFARKIMTGGTWDDVNQQWTVLPSAPDAPLTMELQDENGNFIAKGTVDPATMPWSSDSSSRAGSLVWAEAVLTDAAGNPIDAGAAILDGTRYRVVVKTEGLTVGRYELCYNSVQATTVPSLSNSYLGTEAYMLSSADGGANWTTKNASDIPFSLGVIIPGDANGDGLVDVGDLGIMGANYGLAGTWTQADFNDDGVIDVGDLGILGAHYGERLPGVGDIVVGPGGSGSLVPEPATIGLLAVGALAVIRRRRR